jgi:hypothetical protein
VSRAGRLIGALVAVGVAMVLMLAACSGSAEGTVVAKSQPVYDYSCQAGGTVSGPVAVPAWGSCADPKCWRLVVRDSAGNTAEPCVSRAEYDSAQVGEFWHEPTD